MFVRSTRRRQSFRQEAAWLVGKTTGDEFAHLGLEPGVLLGEHFQDQTAAHPPGGLCSAASGFFSGCATGLHALAPSSGKSPLSTLSRPAHGRASPGSRLSQKIQGQPPACAGNGFTRPLLFRVYPGEMAPIKNFLAPSALRRGGPLLVLFDIRDNRPLRPPCIMDQCGVHPNPKDSQFKEASNIPEALSANGFIGTAVRVRSNGCVTGGLRLSKPGFKKVRSFLPFC